MQTRSPSLLLWRNYLLYYYLHKYKIEQWIHSLWLTFFSPSFLLWVELYTCKRRFCSLLNFFAMRLSNVLTYDFRQVMSLMLAQ